MFSLNHLLTLGVTIVLPALVNAIAMPDSPGLADSQLDKRDPQGCLPTCARATPPPKLMDAFDFEKRQDPSLPVTGATYTGRRVYYTPPPKLMDAADLEKRQNPSLPVTGALYTGRRVYYTPPPKLMDAFRKRESDDEGDLGDTTGDPNSVFEKRAGALQAAATGGTLT